ncbi:leucine--tRNA ligase [Halobaculum sp. MBLA0147]|uniref:leucine--tRNA ligase n=1 Tax=Halobaculum sp. MBLA0147 TaxID=3079934 RepID=UPI0035236286
MSEYDPQEIESRWRDRWAEDGTYEPAPDPDGDADATFVTVPYPYPSGGMHLGHCRTYTVPDVYARYRRQQGDNVLYPMAWHVTGTPIIGAVERLKKREPEQMSVLQDTYGVSDDALADMETPMGFATHFVEEHYKTGMDELGLSVDWRREFTTEDDRYSKFVTWQYETLKDRGLLEKGLHPVKYCTNEEQPVTTHDLLEGEEAEFQEYTLVRFRATVAGEDSDADAEAEEVIAPMATLRPETVRGVTNAYVDPQATYVVATVDGESWLISASAAEKFRLQERNVTVRREVAGETLVGTDVTNPVTGEAVPILPADFVDADNATGVVMSVPAHSPDDYVALREAKADAESNPERFADYGLAPERVSAIEPVPILDVEGYGDVPARDAVESAGIESSDDPSLEQVTNDLYNAEFHQGRLHETYGEFANGLIEEVRDEFKAQGVAAGHFDTMQEFSEEVVCRCGGDVEVAKQDTWFLRYNDDDWKAATKRVIEGLDAIPENTRSQYTDTVDWLNEWPCIRNYGLGTRLPWDPEFVIEPLSDSTIYMAYYTVAHRVQRVPTDALDREFFDALFYGAEAVDDLPEAVDAADPSDALVGRATDAGSEIDRRTSDEIADADAEADTEAAEYTRAEKLETAFALRAEWQYWYPVDYRFSANDLIENHLTFYQYHHAELFDEPEWPQGIVVMGMGLLEGEKMSSSKGNVVLPGEAVSEYGADTVRFFLLNAAEPWEDYDWRSDAVVSVNDQLTRFYERASETIAAAEADGLLDGAVADGGALPESPTARLADADLEPIDEWLVSTLQDTVETATQALERAETRTASQAVFYDFDADLRWYRRRTDTDREGARRTLLRVLETRLRLLAPFVPFLTNELHEELTGVPAEAAAWPEPVDELRAPDAELREERVEALTEDVRDIVEVTDRDPETVRVYVAADWKRDVFDAVREAGADVGAAMSEAMSDPDLRERGDAVNDLVQDLVEFARGADDERLAALADLDERAAYEAAADFVAREFDATVEVYAEDDADLVDPDGKASQAVPFRPAIHIE